MAKLETRNIRNIAIVGHGGCGKTLLAEAMLFNAKAVTRIGEIEAGKKHLNPGNIVGKKSGTGGGEGL